MNKKVNILFSLSGILAFIMSMIFFLIERYDFDLIRLILLIIIPAGMTILIMRAVYLDNNKLMMLRSSHQATKVVIIGLCSVLLFYQLFMTMYVLQPLVEVQMPNLVTGLQGYFYLIGAINNVMLLYKITATRDEVQIRE